MSLCAVEFEEAEIAQPTASPHWSRAIVIECLSLVEGSKYWRTRRYATSAVELPGAEPHGIAVQFNEDAGFQIESHEFVKK